jgi:murein DD-endopeptidase MepM/ murein hydrolase activator NlpD
MRGRRRRFLGTVRGLVVTGLAAGALLASALVAARLLMLRGGTLPPDAEEPVAVAPVAPPAADLRERSLLIPVKGIEAAALTDTFADARGGGTRVHHALDILAPRGTPVVAADAGRVVRLHNGGAGGITVYELDPSGRYGYYYAHLQGYADGLAEGQTVARGDVLGFVGTTGNAPPGTPHLHFAIYEVQDATRPWRGRPIDPYPLWR